MKELFHVFSKVNDLDIKTREQLLQHEELYEELFLAIDHFITHTAFRSHLNIERLLELRRFGIDSEDVRYDTLARCIEKLDLILANDLEHMVRYCYTIVNHCVITTYRNAIKELNMIVSLEETLDCYDDDDSKVAKTLEYYLADQRASTETLCIAKDEVLELFDKYSNNCDALLCMIARNIFDDTPKEIANVLISQGSVSKAIAIYQTEISELYGITPDEFPVIAPIKKTGLSRVLSKGITEIKPVASKISNIINRVK